MRSMVFQPRWEKYWHAKVGYQRSVSTTPTEWVGSYGGLGRTSELLEIIRHYPTEGHPSDVLFPDQNLIRDTLWEPPPPGRLERIKKT